MPWVKVTCGDCGHQADINDWTATPIYGDLPRGEYQCPSCGVAFKRSIGPSEIIGNGHIIPGQVSLVPVAGRM